MNPSKDKLVAEYNPSDNSYKLADKTFNVLSSFKLFDSSELGFRVVG
jgi:hypothetical protein